MSQKLARTSISDNSASRYPLWGSSSLIRGESLLWTASEADRQRFPDSAFADLLFAPRRLLRVYSANRRRDYPLENFTVEGRRIRALSTDDLPVFTRETLYPRQPSDLCYGHHLDGKRFIRYSEGHYFHDLQLCIDYETDEAWDGPVPDGQSRRLPRLASRLAMRQPVRVALLGDSISAGCNVSGEMGAPPFQPSWSHLFADRFGRRAGCPVDLMNFARAGMTARWGIEQTQDIAAVRPHLLIVAFGMNDISEKLPVPTFIEGIRAIINQMRNGSPDTEFLLISGMDPNPDWHLSFSGERQAAHEALIALAAGTDNTALCDVRSPWNHLVSRKGFWSVCGNGINHPNDFGHRFYADCLLATLDNPSTHP